MGMDSVQLRISRLPKVPKGDAKFPITVYHPVDDPVVVRNEEDLTRYLRNGWSTRRGAFSEIEGMKETIKRTKEALVEMEKKLVQMIEKRKEEERWEKSYTPPIAAVAAEVTDEEEGDEGVKTDEGKKTDEEIMKPKGKYVCSICERDCQNAAALAAHMKTHSPKQ